ncbi:bifunctional homocysteine S-methyltransferase/5,10-methylenetetrahydrofolate reductase protein [Roseovarius sp. THAF8]|uniref:homocysteine S-methyltransferase family protein n=1 Tax=Roseovarius sp. THAF8 TaxID=2587846 RepID=UPI0012688C29|nr:homocysteine S-methyltransferase family protein [Roseovarius sp. THAF8]QFT96053.1 bifunctional homocysteine S-methyltransferase/5,10-methylenetetrahydrofolate reductase protein [Roseovarius sp. THAF8]
MAHAASFNNFITSNQAWVADGGLETDLIFSDGLDLPHFASFHVFDTEEGCATLARYYDRYIEVARSAGTGFVLDTATWRSGAFWPETVGRSLADLEAATREAVRFARDTRGRHADVPMVLNGAIGPAGDGYAPDRLYNQDAAEALHAHQVRWMAEEGIEMITAVTMTHPDEAIGLVRAASDWDLPVVVSFTTETDGHLPTGETIEWAITKTDVATGGAPVFYMINCAHPDHFAAELAGDWTSRIGGIRANASRMSHEELDEAQELDAGDPDEFGKLYGDLFQTLPRLRVIGGCCGTDKRHIGCAAHHVINRFGQGWNEEVIAS